MGPDSQFETYASVLSKLSGIDWNKCLATLPKVNNGEESTAEDSSEGPSVSSDSGERYTTINANLQTVLSSYIDFLDSESEFNQTDNEPPEAVVWWLFVMSLASNYYASKQANEESSSRVFLLPPESVVSGPNRAVARLISLAHKYTISSAYCISSNWGY